MSNNRQSQLKLSFPGEDARETWLCGVDGSCQRLEDSTLTIGDVLGIEVLALDSAPFWFLKREGMMQDTGDAVTLRWEALGVQNDGMSSPWTHWPVTETEKQLLIGTLAIAEETVSLHEWGRIASFQRFEPSARLLPLPADGMAIWKEMGRLVVAFTVRKELLHLAVLSSLELDADAAFEVRDLYQALLAGGFCVSMQTIQVWTRCETDFLPQMACLFESADFHKQARPDPVLQGQPSGLLPAQVAAKQRQKKARQNKLLLLAAAAMVYLCFFAMWWLRLQLREARLSRTQAELAQVQPQLESIREAQSRWLDMEAAIDPNLYPLEIFHQIISLLPDEGIRLKEFQMDDGKLIVGGEATTVNHALGFKDKLAACEPLQRYEWNFPVPRIRDEDNRAEFRAVGILTGRGGHEGQ